MIDLKGAKVVVIGMAKSGVAAVELLIGKGARVRAVDQNPVANDKLASLGVTVEPQEESVFRDADLVVLSPGVPADIDAAASARAMGVPVIGDFELATWFLRGDVIGITGANGKTTTTSMTGHILGVSGIPAQLGGNIGTAPAAMVSTSRDGQWNVLELSSFQLETSITFRPRIGAALNVTPDHLDRHYTFEKYAEAKARMFVNQCPEDFKVLNADDPTTCDYAGRGSAQTHWFSSTRTVERGAYLRGDEILLDGRPFMAASEVPLRGAHNVENVMAAAVMTNLVGASPEQIRAGVISFPGVEHRLEFVRTVAGAAYYNDSKATNVDAALKAVAAFPSGLWVVLGGKDKKGDYTPLGVALKSKAHGVLLIGAAAPIIERQLKGSVPMIMCGTLDVAITEARARAHDGDTVLLAPACASFDQFENYEHRGREFKRLVNALGDS